MFSYYLISAPNQQVDVLVEMKDATTVIPRNSLIEANQSGLIAEPLIDITPQAPVPQYKGAGGGGVTSAGSCSNHAAAATAQQTSTCQIAANAACAIISTAIRYHDAPLCSQPAR